MTDRSELTDLAALGQAVAAKAKADEAKQALMSELGLDEDQAETMIDTATEWLARGADERGEQ